jgi:hypothetical protein
MTMRRRPILKSRPKPEFSQIERKSHAKNHD